MRHWTNLHPSRLFQVALSAANHFCTTVWSEVPRWTRSCWVRISLYRCLKAAKNPRCGRSKKNQTLFTNLTWLKVILAMIPWFSPFSKANFRSEVGWSQAERKVSLGNRPWDQCICQTVMDDIKLCYFDFTPCLSLFSSAVIFSFYLALRRSIGVRWSSFAWKTLGQGAMRYLGNGRR